MSRKWWGVSHLRLDQDQVDKQHDKVVLDILVAEAAAVLAHRQPDVVPARLVAAALAPERLDRVPAFYADGHGCGGRMSLRGELARDIALELVVAAGDRTGERNDIVGAQSGDTKCVE